MKQLPLVILLMAVSSGARAVEPLPTFPEAKIIAPPLSLADSARQAPNNERPLEGRLVPRPFHAVGRAVFAPRNDVDYKLTIKEPDSAADYKLIIKGSDPEATK